MQQREKVCSIERGMYTSGSEDTDGSGFRAMILGRLERVISARDFRCMGCLVFTFWIFRFDITAFSHRWQISRFCLRIN